MRCRVTHSPEEAAEALWQGSLVALPTETVYGLGAMATDPRAVAAIFAAKERPAFDPLIVHVPDIDHVSRVAAEFPPMARRLADRFWPGPLTLVLPKTPGIPDLVTSGMPTVGVRIPDHALTRQVLRLADVPIAAPSANPFGRLSPTTVEHVLAQLGDRIDLVLDGGPCRVGVESTILQLEGDEVTLLRPGGIPLEDIEPVVGRVRLPETSTDDRPISPGRLASHYAPRTPVELVDRAPDVAEPCDSGDSGLLLLMPRSVSGYARIEVLSATGNLSEAAANFFPALHRLDSAGLSHIVAERCPETGLGRAVNDRLQRAAAPR